MVKAQLVRDVLSRTPVEVPSLAVYFRSISEALLGFAEVVNTEPSSVAVADLSVGVYGVAGWAFPVAGLRLRP